MKSLKILSVAVLTAGLALPAFAANDTASSSEQNQNSNLSPGRYGPSASMIRAIEAKDMILGTAGDPATSTITISEYNSGSDQTFSVAGKEDLKSRDKVTETSQKNNPSAIQKVEKENRS